MWNAEPGGSGAQGPVCPVPAASDPQRRSQAKRDGAYRPRYDVSSVQAREQLQNLLPAPASWEKVCNHCSHIHKDDKSSSLTTGMTAYVCLGSA